MTAAPVAFGYRLQLPMPIELLNPVERRRGLDRALQAMVALDGAVVLIGTVFLWHTVKTVLITGPVLAGVAAVTLTLAVARRHGLAIAVSLGHLAICGLFVTLVHALRWGPAPAYWPFCGMSSAYCVIIAVPTIRAIRRKPDGPPPGTCAGCGYLLHGLPEPRCPECGQPFDPTLARTSGPPGTP